MNVQGIVSLALLYSVMVCAILMGAAFATFIDATSIAILMGVLVGGILWSHSLSDVLRAFGTFLSTGPVDAERSRRDHRTFMRLADLSAAVCWIGPIMGIIQILRRLEDPRSIGPGMAVVLLTIFYGTAAGELLFRPAAAACLNRTRPAAEPTTGPIAFHRRKLLSVALMVGLVSAGLSFTGSIQIFIDLPSIGIVIIATILGLFVSHPASDVRQILRSVFGPETMHPEHAERGAAMFHRLAELAVATGLLGTLIGLIQMLQSLEDPSAIGPALGVALLTVFYGVLLSEVFFRSATTDCIERGQVQAEEWRHRYPNRTVGVVGRLLFVIFTFILMLISSGFPYLCG